MTWVGDKACPVCGEESCSEMHDDPAVTKALQELEVQRQIVLALAPLSPRMRAAVLRFVVEKLEDDRERGRCPHTLENGTRCYEKAGHHGPCDFIPVTR